MSAAVTSVRSATNEEWDEAWKSSPAATFFHSREWAELWSAYTDGHVEPHARFVELSDGRTAVLPFLRKGRLFGLVRMTLSSYAETFGGWISRDELAEEHAAALADLIMRGSGNVRWKINPFDPLARPFLDRATRDDETLAIDLSEDFDALFRRWTKGHRSAVGKARREGVQVRKADSLDDWRAYYGLFLESQERWGERAFFRYRWDLFEELHRLRSPFVTLWLATHEQRIVAGHVFLYSKTHVADWHGAASSEGFHLRPVNLLMYEVLRDAHARGFRWFDFGSSGPLEGVRAFKKSFGARPLPCPTIEVEAGWLRWLRRVRRALAPPRWRSARAGATLRPQ